MGMHDALVEITGILAGLAMAITGTRILILTGIIASVSASLSMAAANYMAQRTDNNPDALMCALYTGVTYLTTSAAVIVPFVFIPHRGWALGVMAGVAIVIIGLFNWWTSCDGARPLRDRFLEMLGVCMGVSVTSFVIGQLAKHFLGVSI